MLNRLVSFMRACAASRLAWILALAHAAWFFVAIANMSPPSPQLAHFLDQNSWSSATLLAGRPFHFHYESNLLKILFLVDLPSLIIMGLPLGAIVDAILIPLHVGIFAGSYFGAGLFLFTGTSQWLAFGKLIEDRMQRRQFGRPVLQRLNRHWVLVIIMIGLFTIIVTPIVNNRSRRLGFRHAAISFH